MFFIEPVAACSEHEKSGVLILYNSLIRYVTLLFMLTPLQFPTGKFFDVLISIWSLVTSITGPSLKQDGGIGVSVIFCSSLRCFLSY